MKVRYLTNTEEALQALDELSSVKKVCIDYETTGLDPHVSVARLLQICDTKPDNTDRTVYVFDLWKTDVK